MSKYIPLFIFTTLFVSCNESKNPAAEKHTPNFDWILGDWQRTNDKNGEQTFEHWKKINDSTYTSHGYTIANGDTVWQEWAELSPKGLDWYFQARMIDDSVSTNFLLTEMTDISFVCQNPENEFPKEIRYQKNGNELHAEISADESIVSFQFIRKK